jgi:hypothetical protein
MTAEDAKRRLESLMRSEKTFKYLRLYVSRRQKNRASGLGTRAAPSASLSSLLDRERIVSAG